MGNWSGEFAINIGVFLPNWIGDVVMATPMLRALRNRFEHAKIVGIVRPYVRDVLEGSAWLDDTVLFDPRATCPSLRSQSLIRKLRERELDSVVITTNSFRTAMIAFAARVPQRIGYVRYGRGPLLTERLRPPRAGRRLLPISAVDYYLGLAKAIGASGTDKSLQLATTIAGDEQAADIWRRMNLDRSGPVIGICTGAAYGAAKEWPVEYFASLARQLVTRSAAKAIVLCGPSERDAARRIVNLANHVNVCSLADESVSIDLTKSVISRCDMLISNDSGPRHIGAGFAVPTLTLFGPTDPRWSHNFQTNAVDLQLSVPCGPCAQRTCPLRHHRCMRDMTVEQVYDTAHRMLRSLMRTAHLEKLAASRHDDSDDSRAA